MHRLPLADELPYRFVPPRPSPFWFRASRPLRRRMLRGEHQVVGVDISGLDRLKGPLERGDSLMICPNHCARADGLVLFDVADRLGRTFCAMAAYQIFEGIAGLRRWLFPRLGMFPVDREGADLAALKTATEVLGAAQHPLLVFPEGEVYYLADRLTPLRDGVAFLATRAHKTLAERGKTVWIAPVALKYRFPDGHDPLPAFHEKVRRLEERILWWPREDMPLIERIYRYAEAALALKELEYLGGTRSGPLRERIVALRRELLDRIEQRHCGKAIAGTDPERIKELRRRCLDALEKTDITPEARAQVRQDLNDLYVAVQTLSYPGDYVFGVPSCERVAETLMKLDEDVLNAGTTRPAGALGPRRAVVQVGEPIDVGTFVGAGKRPREVVGAITTELERRLQAELDAIGSGRPLPASALGQLAFAQASSSG
jgi:1-acyl-sn-glycerol-3-phosphate acyltransferase